MTQEQIERPTGTLVSAIALAAATLGLAGRMPSAMESFHEMFSAFGADLPGVTKFVLAFPYIWWLLALAAVALLIWIIRKSHVTREELGRMKRGLVLLFAATLAAYALVAVAIYWPIFKLGQAV